VYLIYVAFRKLLNYQVLRKEAVNKLLTNYYGRRAQLASQPTLSTQQANASHQLFNSSEASEQASNGSQLFTLSGLPHLVGPRDQQFSSSEAPHMASTRNQLFNSREEFQLASPRNQLVAPSDEQQLLGPQNQLFNDLVPQKAMVLQTHFLGKKILHCTSTMYITAIAVVPIPLEKVLILRIH